MVEMKKQIDRPIARLIRDLDERGLLSRTLVMITTEFGRTIAAQPAAGVEPDGFAERHTGEKLIIENEKMYGFHGHFSSCNSMYSPGRLQKRFFMGGLRTRTPWSWWKILQEPGRRMPQHTKPSASQQTRISSQRAGLSM
jgi:hypothetical protein